MTSDPEMRRLLLQLELAEKIVAMPIDEQHIENLRRAVAASRKRLAEARARKLAKRHGASVC
jgi:predicted house-cleaning NTP pyrophosphatase (Maf/HAM1 superfamily)